ncbi:MAG: RCC1 domain-containing protein [Gemmatimonadota bacterium]
MARHRRRAALTAGLIGRRAAGVHAAGRAGLRAALAAGLATALPALAGACAEITDPTSPPVRFATVEVGGAHSCAVSTEGDAYCWGRGANGELGEGRTRSTGEPVRVAADRAWTGLALGFHHSCGLDEAGRVHCWGWNANEQLGLGPGATGVRRPNPVVGELRFTAITAGWYHTCGLDEDGAAHCWGYNAHGQVGDGSTADRPAPTPVAGGHRFEAIAAGGLHTCGVTTDGGAYCWGWNAWGQLGDGSTNDSAVPTELAGARRFDRIAAGFTHSCGIARGGGAFCWGSNHRAELGINAVTMPGGPGVSTPMRVAREEDWLAVRAGLRYTCAVDVAGRAFCWGEGEDGQLGNGNTVLRDKPFHMREPRFRELVAGEGTHTCGVARTADRVYCWGYGEHGQLGRGEEAFVVSPRPIHDVTGDE